MAELEVATKRHAREAGRELSLSSRGEIFALGNWTSGERYLRAMLNRSGEAFALRAPDGRLLAVWGLLPVGRGWASPWLATTVHAAHFPILLLSMARIVMETWRTDWGNMVFYVHAADARGQRLAVKLGLQLGPAEKRGQGFFRKVVVETRKIEVA